MLVKSSVGELGGWGRGGANETALIAGSKGLVVKCRRVRAEKRGGGSQFSCMINGVGQEKTWCILGVVH